MSENIDNLPGSDDEDNQGQAQVNQETGQRREKINLYDLPDFKAWQSKEHKQRAEIQRRAEEAERRAQLAEQRLNQVVRQVEQIDPQAGQELLQSAQIADLQYKADLYEALQWERNWEQEVLSVGGDPTDPAFRAALQRARSIGNNSPVQQYLMDIERQKMTAELKEELRRELQAQLPQELDDSTRQTMRDQRSPVPPTGGKVLNSVEQRRQAYEDRKLKLRQGDMMGLIALRREFSDIVDEGGRYI